MAAFTSEGSGPHTEPLFLQTEQDGKASLMSIHDCFRGNSMGYHGNSKILLPWGVQLHRVFYSVDLTCKNQGSN